jgi:hypothetical protein
MLTSCQHAWVLWASTHRASSSFRQETHPCLQ